MSVARWLFLSILTLIAAMLLAAALTPSLRERLQARFTVSGREILATVDGDVLNDGSRGRAIKFRDRRGIFVEILKDTDDGVTHVIDRVQLPDRHDGLFNLQGQVTRLAIADVDGDGKLELLAPSFDNQLVPHLNVFRYNPALARFEPVQPGPTAHE